MTQIKSVLFDFDGVLSNGRFYSTLSDSQPDLQKKIANALFSKAAWPLVQTWMRGELQFEDIHAQIAPTIDTDVETLNRALIESILTMTLNQELLKFNSQLRSAGIKTSIFTDNMDIFERLLVPYNNLTEKFDYIFSSSTAKKLKLDNNAQWLQEVITTTNIPSEATLFLDDSPKIGVYMQKIGGHFYCYQDYQTEYPKFKKAFETQYAID